MTLPSCTSVKLNHSFNHKWGNICLGAWPGQTNWHFIQSIASSWGRDHSSSSSPRGTGSWPGGKSWGSEMLTQLLWRPLRGAPSRALYPSTACRSMKWQTGAGCQGAETQCLPTNCPPPQSGQENWPWNLQAGKGGSRYRSRLDLSTAPGGQRGLCVITSWSPRPALHQDSFLRKSRWLQRNGWPSPSM